MAYYLRESNCGIGTERPLVLCIPKAQSSQLLMESFYARVLSTRRDASRLKVLELRDPRRKRNSRRKRSSAPHLANLATRFELLAATGTAGYPGVLILDRRVDGKEI
jgi:hypothetical protein